MPSSAQTSALPGEPLPVRLANTLWAERGELRDDLGTPHSTLHWLHDNGFPTTTVDPDGALATADLRAALRTVAASLTTDPPEGCGRPGDVPPGDLEDALQLVNRYAHAAPPGHLAVVEGRVRWVAPSPGATVEDALVVIAGAALTLLAGPEASHLRACHGPRCIRYFVQDHPRREWCSPACGNRARASRHYRRRTAAPDPGAD